MQGIRYDDKGYKSTFLYASWIFFLTLKIFLDMCGWVLTKKKKKIATSKSMHHMKFWKFLHHTTSYFYKYYYRLQQYLYHFHGYQFWISRQNLSYNLLFKATEFRSFLLHLHVHLPSIVHPWMVSWRPLLTTYPKLSS